MTEPMASIADNIHEHPCTQCDGFVERELVAIYPASDVCLECMRPAERRRLEQELNQVQELDRSLLPELPRVPGWELGLHYRPSRLLSGDFYDVGREPGAMRLTLLIGDVMGKGMPAALLRTGLMGALKALAGEIGSPAGVLERANRYFIESASPGRLASVFYGSLDLSTGELRYANAGHLPPLLRRTDGEWQVLDSTGMVFGALGSAPYAEKTVSLLDGDLVVLYSDGITEAVNGDGQFFDEVKVMSVLNGIAPDAPVQAMASAVANELGRFAPGNPSDDRTLVLVRRS